MYSKLKIFQQSFYFNLKNKNNNQDKVNNKNKNKKTRIKCSVNKNGRNYLATVKHKKLLKTAKIIKTKVRDKNQLLKSLLEDQKDYK